MYHYHNFSPCLNKNFLNNKVQDDCRDGPCEDDPVSWALSGYQDEWGKQKRIIGISKDGRPLYGPYKDTAGNLWWV